jgi:predicted RNase H-like nuclease (RuvC/YqgF family)
MLCKFGCTDDFPRRIAEHHRYFKREFGNDCNIEILQFSIIEAQFIHNAETNIAQYFKTNLVKYKTSRELIVINKDDLPHIKQHYSMIQANYIGRFSELYAQLAEKEKEILALQYKLSELAEKHRNELQAERHKCEIMTERYKLQTEVMAEKHRNELKDKDIELLTTKVKFMEKK